MGTQQQTSASEEEVKTIMTRRPQSFHTGEAQHSPIVVLQIGDSLVRLTAQQARRLASVLVVQANTVAVARTEPADSFLVDGWIAKPSGVPAGVHRKILIACRASNVILREADDV